MAKFLDTSGLTYLWGKIKAALNNKVDVEAGKGLSTEDYTTAEKNKLSGIATGAEVNVQPDWDQSDSTADDFIKNKPIEVVYCKATSILPTSSGGTVKAVFTDIPLKYLDQDNIIFVLSFKNTISNTLVLNELVVNDFYGTDLVDYYVGIGITTPHGAEFTYLNGVYGSYKIHDGETVVFKRVTLSAYGEDYERYLVLGVFPKYAEIDYNSLINTPTLSTVATSGNYNDLTNKLTAGTNINISASNKISATDTKPSDWMSYEWTDNVPNLTAGYGHSCTLTKGIWLVYLYAYFPTNANGYRYYGLTKAGDNTGYTYRYCTSQPAVNGSQTCVTSMVLVNVTSTSEAWLTRMYHNAGTNVTLSVINGYKAIKLM